MVKMSLGASNSQSSSTSSVSSEHISAYNNAISSLTSFISASDLQGQAYSSAKSYASSVLIPLIQGAILLSEAVSTSVSEFPNRYTSEVAGESLDSEVLEAQIATYQAAYNRTSALLESLMSKEVLNPRTISQVQSSMSRNMSKIRELQEKLDNLLAFDASSPSIFDEISSLELAVSQGLSQVSSDFRSFHQTQSFPDYGSANLPWKQTIYYHQVLLEQLDSGEVSEITSNQTLTNAKKYLKLSQKGYIATHLRQLDTTAKNGVPHVVYKHGNKHLDSLFGADKFISSTRIRKGKEYTFISSNGKTVRNGSKAFFETTGLLYPESVIQGHPVNWQAVKSNLKAMSVDKGLEAMKGRLSFGVTPLISDYKAFKNAKGLGKTIPGVSLAAGVFEVGAGINETDEIALKHGLKQGSIEYTTSQIADLTVDATKAGVDVAVSTVAYSAGATAATAIATTVGLAAAAPVAVGIGAVALGVTTAVLVTTALSPISEKLVADTKEVTTKSIRSISNGMKNLGTALGRVFG